MKAFSLVVGAWLCTAAAHALINPNFTPVDLVRQSVRIQRLEIAPWTEGTPLVIRVVKDLRGEVPGTLRVTPEETDEELVRTLREALGEARSTAAMLFDGDFADATEEDALTEEGAPTGVLQIGTEWFALTGSTGDGYRLIRDPFNMKAVWAGDAEMLHRASAYIIEDPHARVPPRVGVTWDDDIKIADLSGRARQCLAVPWRNRPLPLLHVASGEGDRLFEPDGQGAFRDISGETGLKTASKRAAWGDLDGDGRLDLVSWDGTTLRVYPRDANDRFGKPILEERLDSRCLSLEVVYENGNTRLVAGTARGLALIGRNEGRIIQAPVATGPGVVCDFNGDGSVDTVQGHAGGLTFHPGGSTPRGEALQANLGEELNALVPGDFDTDGQLDLLTSGRTGCSVVLGNGDGTFRDHLHAAGELSYISKPGTAGALAFDANNDGRQDLLLLYHDTPPQVFFNRGFACFGYAVELEIADRGRPADRDLAAGQLAATAADFTGNGRQELVILARNGALWMLTFKPPLRETRALQVDLGPGMDGPLAVVGYDNTRCLGARWVNHGAPAFFGKRTRGPLQVKWRRGGASWNTRQVIVLKPTRLQLVPEE